MPAGGFFAWAAAGPFCSEKNVAPSISPSGASNESFARTGPDQMLGGQAGPVQADARPAFAKTLRPRLRQFRGGSQIGDLPRDDRQFRPISKRHFKLYEVVADGFRHCFQIRAKRERQVSQTAVPRELG